MSMENLIDLRKFGQEDVELIAREFLRMVYIEACTDYAKEVQKEDGKDEEVITSIEEILKSLEQTIILLDGDDEFLKFITSEADGNSTEEDGEFDRF